MKILMLASIVLAFTGEPTEAQYGPPPGTYPPPGYGGPPMWRGERRGPQVVPCIYYGDCRGPRYDDLGPPRMPPNPMHPRGPMPPPGWYDY